MKLLRPANRQEFIACYCVIVTFLDCFSKSVIVLLTPKYPVSQISYLETYTTIMKGFPYTEFALGTLVVVGYFIMRHLVSKHLTDLPVWFMKQYDLSFLVLDMLWHIPSLLMNLLPLEILLQEI